MNYYERYEDPFEPTQAEEIHREEEKANAEEQAYEGRVIWRGGK